MKKSIFFTGALFSLSFFLLLHCNKPQTITENKNEVEHYVIKSKREQMAGRKSTESRVVATTYFDYSQTNKYELGYNGSVYFFFYTPIYESQQSQNIVGALIGYVLPGGSVFNVVYDVASQSDGISQIDVFSLSGDELGRLYLDSVQVIDRTVATSIGIDNYTPLRRSWWTCTIDCVGDAHHACWSDKQCATLLLATNIGGAYVQPKLSGAGSISIAAACGAACAWNTNLDLLPAY